MFRQFLKIYITVQLTLFSIYLYSNQVKITVQGFINLDQNVVQFKEHLRDFLVQIRVRSAKCLFLLTQFLINI